MPHQDFPISQNTCPCGWGVGVSHHKLCRICSSLVSTTYLFEIVCVEVPQKFQGRGYRIRKFRLVISMYSILQVLAVANYTAQYTGGFKLQVLRSEYHG